MSLFLLGLFMYLLGIAVHSNVAEHLREQKNSVFTLDSPHEDDLRKGKQQW